MLPPAMMPPGYAQTIADIRGAIETRLLGMRISTPVKFHRGTPDLGALDSAEQVAVWLDWTDVNPDADEPQEATMLVSSWAITIIGKDEGDDAFGGEAPAVERIWGDILATLTETLVDLGLDGTCDFVPTPNASHLRGNLSGGDRTVEVIEMRLEVHHSQELFRQNPA